MAKKITKPHRITVSLTKKQYQLISRMAELRGTARSKIVTEFIPSLEPVFERLIPLIEKAHNADATVLEAMKKRGKAAEREIEPILQQAINQLDIFANG